jgi:Tol biopolymer transport system component
MAEVYRALDTRLDRLVAIKVLPHRFSSSQKSRERFEVEARAISGLSHPNICRLYDVGKDDDIDYLILEYLEGETLADRLDRGPLPTRQYLPIAIEMAEALDHAHRRGILHRDIKPSNIMLTRDGARLMDFGVAKLLDPPTDGVPNIRHAKPSKVTEDDKVVGTYDYMAPEQTAGREVDARTDIFAIGAVIYEMATGRRALRRMVSPPQGPVPGTGSLERPNGRKPVDPPALDHVIEVCLAEDPEDRWQSARDLVNELRWISQVEAAKRARRTPMGWLRWASPAVLAVALAAVVAWKSGFRPPSAAVLRPLAFTITAPQGTSMNITLTGGMMAISPDGERIAFVATENDIPAIWIRSLGNSSPVKLSHTEGASYPFWSPDNHTVGFFADGKLKVIDITDSPEIIVCDAPDTRGGSWNRNGTILFSPLFKGGLYAVSLNNQLPYPITHPPGNSFESHRWPSFLPDGKHFLFTVVASEQPGIYVGALDDPKRVRLLPDVSKAEYSALGYLLFDRDGHLVAQKFDPIRLQLSGEVMEIAGGVRTSFGYAPFSSSGKETIAYRATGRLETRLSIYDQNGTIYRKIALPPDKDFEEFDLAPNHDRLAMTLNKDLEGNKRFDVWLADLSSGRFYPLTSDGVSGTPVWSPGGARITLSKRVDGNTDLVESEPANSKITSLLYRSADYKVPLAWSHSGRYLVYCTSAKDSTVRYMVLAREDPGNPRLLLATNTSPYQESVSLSPDDHWIAFASNVGGITQIYVSPFPGPSEAQYQVSVDGGSEPTWDKSGKVLYFLDLKNRIMRVDIAVGRAITAARPQELFRIPAESGDGDEIPSAVKYSLIPQGPRFLIATRVPERPAADLEVVVNYLEARSGN